jgi:rRNA maturation protein Nop10|nr:MAG TPA: late expression factor 5 [Caudoviricetes sp.]DAW46704.1 MAG TPA: late expression factor 5 [Caudoviricetes sp.]DAZ09262.1 MAG TPA: late expression factor 5 [Caudoviricetes sp.]
MKKLITRIRQRLCQHYFVRVQTETKHDEEYYTLTHVCTKCGRKVVTKFPRYYLIGVKDNHE